jgi:NADH-quinone oxidoreductase subunit H
MNIAGALFTLFVFPGFIFLSVYGLAIEFIDRKLYARLQNRKGPPWFQPLADFIKLASKETIIPEEADKKMFRQLPLFSLAAASTAILYVPVIGIKSAFPFEGDLIVVLYLLTLPTLTFFLAGWFSKSLFASIGSVRTLTQLFAYEVPLFMSILGPALLANTWSVTGIAQFYSAHPLYALFNLPGLVVSLIAVQGKLERVPFDIPDAETEIVGGVFTEYSGRLLALFRMSIDVELVVCAALVAAIFIPFYAAWSPVLSVLVFLVKTLLIVFLLAVLRSGLARLRIEQMVKFCWNFLVPISLLQIIIDILLEGRLPR